MPVDVPRFVRTDDKSFIRDTHSKALLNTDAAALQRHRARLRKSQEMDTLHERVDRLEASMNQIHDTMQLILQRLSSS